MEFLEAADQIHVLNGQGRLRTCKSLADFTELSASIPDMLLIDGSHDEPEHFNGSVTDSSTAERFESRSDVAVSILDSDMSDLDSDSRKSGDLQTYSFLLHVLPISASIVYLVFMILTLVSEKFLGSSFPNPIHTFPATTTAPAQSLPCSVIAFC